MTEDELNSTHREKVILTHQSTKYVFLAVPRIGQQMAVKASKMAHLLAACFLCLWLLPGLQPEVLGPAGLCPLSLPGQEGQSRAGSSGFLTHIALLPQGR